MQVEEFGYPIEAMRDRLNLLYQSLQQLPWTQQKLLTEICEELSMILEEIKITQEKYCQHNRARSSVEDTLKQAKQELEFRVEARTSELRATNDHLLSEVVERKRAEVELEKSLSLLEATLESTADGILVVGVDGKAKIFNQKFLQMWGFPESITSWDRQEALTLIKKQLKDPEIFLGKSHQQHSNWEQESYDVLEFKDGRIFERYSQPQRVRGKIVGRVLSFRDITERSHSQAALRKSEEQYRQIIETTAEGVWVIDTDNKTIFANNRMAQMLGYSLEEMLGNSVLAFIHDEWQSLAIAAINYVKHRAQGIKDSFDFKLCRKDGSSLWAIVSANPVFDQSGQYVGILGMFTDITKRKQAEVEVQQSEQKYRNLFHNSLVGMFRSSLVDSTIIDANAAILKMFGFATYEDIKTVDLYVNFADRERLKQLLIEQGFVENFEAQVKRQDNSVFWVSFSAKLYPQEGYLEGVMIDITDRKVAQENSQYQAKHDLLTGLPNRTLFNQELSASLAQVSKSQSLLSVMFLDIDRFKTINDTLGHVVGDRLLQCVAERLTNCLQKDGIVARWGGDEFTFLLPQMSSAEAAIHIAQKILAQFKPAFNLEGHQLHISSSIGIALYPQDGENGDTLLRNADAALYRVKQQGRNNYQFYTAAINSQASELLLLENELYDALEREEFLVYYQPQVNTTTGEITGMEALVRWQHPKLGLVTPAKFIPLAEETGLIVPIGEWVLQTACAQNKAWQDAGFPALRVAVNLSARQFQQLLLLDTVTQTLQQTGLSPEFLELEITETIAMQDMDFSKKILNNLYEMGVQLSIDDFGTGYSSLGYLKQFPLHTLKIDKSFVRDVATDSRNAGIIQAIMTLGRGFNLRVIAEGVETEAQKDCLLSFQCEEMQGYLSSPPLPVEEATQFLGNSYSLLTQISLVA